MTFLRNQWITLLALLLWIPAAGAQDRAAWMKKARWGIMTHYLADWIAQAQHVQMSAGKWNELVDHFDVEGFARQVAGTGAGYLIFTIGQNSGYYLSPNAAYDRLTGAGLSKCARRDLVADLYEALHKHGVKLIVYLPSGAPAGDSTARTALQWRNGPYPNREFQLKWETVIREWSLRWGKKISGWWFDGCYWTNTMYRNAGRPNFHSFAAAARAGNAESAVAFNPGVVYRSISITPDEDYIAGEIDKPALISIKRANDGKVDGKQIQILSFLGEKWGTGNPRFSIEQVLEWSRQVAAAGGAITWDTPLQPNGLIAAPFIEQLTAIGRTMKGVK
jgi:hypothetical protein